MANAIEHAGAEARLKAWLLSDRVIVEITNKGDFGTKGDGQLSERVRGSGLRLMVSLADEVTFGRLEGGATKVRLIFHDQDREA